MPTSTRVSSERSTWLTYEVIVARDKASLDITGLEGDSVEDVDNPPSPDVIAREIVEDLTAALAEFEAVATAREHSSLKRHGVSGPRSTERSHG